MARHTGGWVKFWRKAALGDINSNFTRGGLFGALIAMANIQESTVDWGGEPRKLQRGELVTSIKELADIGETDRRTIDRHLNYLRMRETISYEKRPFGTFIRILNYEDYQGYDADDAKPERNDTLNHTSNHSAHNEERKNKRTKEIYAFSEVFEKVSEEYVKLFPGTSIGPSAKSRFKSQITSKQKAADLEASLSNYRNYLDFEEWRRAKTTFANYLGTARSGFFWTDYIKPIATADVGSPTGRHRSMEEILADEKKKKEGAA